MKATLKRRLMPAALDEKEVFAVHRSMARSERVAWRAVDALILGYGFTMLLLLVGVITAVAAAGVWWWIGFLL